MTEKNPEWIEIEPQIWTPLNEGDEVEGKYLGNKKHIGLNDSIKYYLEYRGSTIAFWDTQLLRERMDLININDYIKIIYKGIVISKNNREVKIFSVKKRASVSDGD